MNLLFLAPSLGYGLILFATSGNGMLLWLSLATMTVWLIHSGNKAYNLEEPIRFEGDRVWIGDRRLGLFPPLWGSKIRNLVYQAAFVSDDPKRIDLEKLEGAIGATEVGDLVEQPVSQSSPHAILIGPTGSGKTELLKLIARAHGGEIWAIDFKSGAGFHGFPNVQRLLTQGNPEALETWKQEIATREQRQLNRPLLIVVDELGEVLRSPALSAFVESIAAKGRSINVMLLAANQTLSQVPRTIWVNCSNRFSVAADLVDRSQLGFAGKSPTPKKGQGTAELLNQEGQVCFNFPFGFRHETAAPPSGDTANPLLSRVASRPL